jgi:uncharacterized protein YbaP (TraB family)
MLASVLLLLTSCNDAPGEAAAGGAVPSPLLYEIASADGAVEGWLIGTIHALPDGTEWRNQRIGRVIDGADLLVVEIAGLEDRASTARIFADLARTSGLPPLDQRLPADLAAPLEGLMNRGKLEPDSFATTETWAAAIALAQVDATGDPANGVDRALIADFAGRRVRELEGVAAQLAIFDRLPEVEQRTMLAAVVRGSEEARRDPGRLQRAWLAGDARIIEASTREGFLADPVLREALLTGRNRRWAAVLLPILKQPARPLIAVGTAHLVGDEGLASLLQAHGYTLRRLP